MNVHDFPFNPLCPSEVFDRAKVWLDKVKDKPLLPLSSSLCHFSVFNKTEAREYFHQACHSHIKLPMIQDVECVATTIRIQHSNNFGEDVSELSKPFLKWLVQDSFYAPFILNGNDLEECGSKGIIISSDIPSNLLQNICILSRHFFECRAGAFSIFNELQPVYGGYVAYSLAFNTSWSYLPTRCQFFDYGGNHRVSSIWGSCKQFKDFCSGDFGRTFIDDPLDYYRKKHVIQGGSRYCRDTPSGHTTFVHELLADPEFKKHISGVKFDEEAGTPTTNPFGTPRPGGFISGKPSYNDMVGIILPFMKEKGHFNAY